ncbi:MAG: hypothetical protein KME12_25855 [Trichocoleus desertorum ATA4-8-CV12]|jgi:hypothetical protein|nr:hypothetical protein [Trichocoleus desertorum ATA4-8-CV12]
MLPLVLSHELVHPFKFWHHNEICEGMYAGTELYRLCTTHQAEDRQKAFCLALGLSEHGAQICITAMRNEYKVWVSLRTLPVAASAPFKQAIAASGFSLKSVEKKVS